MALFRRNRTGSDGENARGILAVAKVVTVNADGSKLDNSPALSLHLLVTVPGEIPFPVSVFAALSSAVLAHAKPGARLPVTVDRATRSVAIDWAAVA